ncbi:hypothetical protein [Streptomyces goshikiensis]
MTNTPPFRCKYGGAEQWSDGNRKLYDPTVNLGYRDIVANGIMGGSHGYYIANQCATAAADSAPKDVSWQHVTDVMAWPKGGYEWLPESNPTEEHKAIVAALTAHAEKLKSTGRSQRRTAAAEPHDSISRTTCV